MFDVLMIAVNLISFLFEWDKVQLKN